MKGSKGWVRHELRDMIPTVSSTRCLDPAPPIVFFEPPTRLVRSISTSAMHPYHFLRRILVVGSFLVLLTSASSWAQTTGPVTFGGEIRVRSEVDARDFNAATSPADVHLLRTRLNAAVNPADEVNVFVEIQDSRRSGAGDPAMARGTMDPAAGRLDFHQAYFEVGDLLGIPLSLRAGRQELVYGNQRLIGSVGWSNVGRSFDAGVLAYDTEGVTIDLFAARLVGTGVEGDGSQNLFGLYSAWDLAPKQTLDVFTLLDNDTNDASDAGGSTGNRLYRLTPGLTIHGSLSPLSYRLEAVYQTGKKAVSPDQKRASIRASLLSAHATYTVGTSANLAVHAGYTRLSGDETLSDDVLGQFNTLFATNHKFYGFMDYFPAAAQPFGLQDVQAAATAQPFSSVGIAAMYHHFRQSETSPRTASSLLGNELDLTLTYQFEEPVTFGLGFSAFRPGSAMVVATNKDDTSYWAFLKSTIAF